MTIWRAISHEPGRQPYNFRPTRNDVNGLSGTRAGEPPYWLDPQLWFLSTFGRLPTPGVDAVVAADEAALLEAGFSVESTPTERDPWHVSIGGAVPGVVVGLDNVSWPGK